MRRRKQAPDLTDELLLVADIALGAVSIVGRLARRAGAEDLYHESLAMTAKVYEIADLNLRVMGEE